MDQTTHSPEVSPRPGRFLRFILALAIVIVLNLFFYYAIRSVYAEPDYQAYCPTEQVTTIPQTQDECVSKGGSWSENQYYLDKRMPVPAGVPAETVRGYCDVNYTCNKNYQSAHDLYQRNVFVVRVILGVGSLVIGFALAAVEAVSLGLSLGGVLSLIIAMIGYWSKLGQYLQVVVLALSLAALIWLGVKKLK
ncbi:MAG: hypothetical protein V4674_03155 [Patescibacteria group bacterium]